MSYKLTHLKELEAESIFILREVAAQFERPVLLFSGGKDSIVMTHLAYKAFYPAAIPFPLLHIDTGHNFPETIEYRDNLVKKIGATLLVGLVQDDIDAGRAVEEKGYNASRNKLQTVTLLNALEKTSLTQPLAEHVGMKKKHVPKSVFSHTAMNSVSGILKINARNCGISLMAKSILESISVYFRSVTGPKWTSGNIFFRKR